MFSEYSKLKQFIKDVVVNIDEVDQIYIMRNNAFTDPPHYLSLWVIVKPDAITSLEVPIPGFKIYINGLRILPGPRLLEFNPKTLGDYWTIEGPITLLASQALKELQNESS